MLHKWNHARADQLDPAPLVHISGNTNVAVGETLLTLIRTSVKTLTGNGSVEQRVMVHLLETLKLVSHVTYHLMLRSTVVSDEL